MKKLTLTLFILGLGYAAPGFAGLVWQVAEVSKKFGDVDVVETAQFYCETNTTDGRSDWRVPSNTELKQIAGSLSGIYWSSTPVKSKSHEALVVDLKNGTERSENTSTFHSVICIHNS